MRERWNLERLTMFVEWHPHFCEVIKVTAQPKTGAAPLERLGFESVIYLVEFIDEENAGFFALERTHERTGTEEVPAFQIGLQNLPVLVLPPRELHVEPLESLIESANSLVLTDASVALEPLDVRVGGLRNRDG
jgi:hypothetical protein